MMNPDIKENGENTGSPFKFQGTVRVSFPPAPQPERPSPDDDIGPDYFMPGHKEGRKLHPRYNYFTGKLDPLPRLEQRAIATKRKGKHRKFRRIKRKRR